MSVTAASATSGVRDRLIEAAAEITCEAGWSAVTMGKVATRAGFSRQTVYNEIGSKPALGQAMVLRELDRFLAVVETELDSHEDIVEAIRSAARRILEMARENPLLDAVLAKAHGVSRGTDTGANNELLPFLTTDAQPLISAATAVIAERMPSRLPGLDLTEDGAKIAIDATVRLVLSHVMQPSDDPATTADGIAWIVERVVRRH